MRLSSVWIILVKTVKGSCSVVGVVLERLFSPGVMSVMYSLRFSSSADSCGGGSWWMGGEGMVVLVSGRGRSCCCCVLRSSKILF